MIKIEKYTENENRNITVIKLLPIFILIAICSLGIGYAAINAITLSVTGTLGTSIQEEIYITGVVDQNENQIDGFYNGTILNSTITLDATDTASTQIYNVTVYNNTNRIYKYSSTICETSKPPFYSNNDIIYTVSDISEQEEIGAYSSKTFKITFKYREDITEITDNILISCIRFVFENSPQVSPDDSILTFDLSGTGGGKAFDLGEVEFNANTETFYMEVDVNSCSGEVVHENIISIGQEISIFKPTISSNKVNLHIFYPSPRDSNIVISPIMNGMDIIQFNMSYAKTMENGIMRMAFNSNGLYINGEKAIDSSGIGNKLYAHDNQYQGTIEDYLNLFFSEWGKGPLTVNIGSTEGDARSYATYNAVQIYKKEMTTAEMISLTRTHEDVEEEEYIDFLTETYNPNKEIFTFNSKFDNMEYNRFATQTLYTEIYIGGTTSQRTKENILSIGHEIFEWTPTGSNTTNLHLYYPDTDGTMILSINLNQQGFIQWRFPLSILNNIESKILKIAFNLNGLYINGVGIVTPEGTHAEVISFSTTTTLTPSAFLEMAFTRLKTGALEVGSKQGDNRSTADYYKFRIYNHRITREEMISLTSS